MSFGSMQESRLRAHRWLQYSLLAVSLLAAYGNSFPVPFVFDDVTSIIENPTIRHIGTAFFPPGQMGYTVGGRPVLNLSLALNWMFGGPNVIGYHGVNLLIHFLGALTLMALIERTLLLPALRPRWSESAGTVAFAASFLWCLHPLQTESVTYVIQRAESLAALFYLLTLYCFSRAVTSDLGRRWWFVASVAACLLGMGTKETMVSAPVIVLLYDRTFCGLSFMRALRERTAYYAFLASTWILLLVCVLVGDGRSATAGFASGVNAWDYWLTQCYALAHYIGLAFWPSGLTFDYGTWLVTDFSMVMLPIAAVLLVGGVAVYALIKRPATGFLLAMYFSLLAPTSLIPIATQTMAEHRMYLPLAVIAIGVALLLQRWLSRWAFLVSLALGIGLGALSFVRNIDYRSEEALWRDTTAKRPENGRAWHSLGLAQMGVGDRPAARISMERAQKLLPLDMSIEVNLGKNSAAMGQIGAAIKHYHRAVEALPADHNELPKIRRELALLLEQHGAKDEALAQLQLALAQNPNDINLKIVLGEMLVRVGRPADAMKQFEAVLRVEPLLAPTRIVLGDLLIKENQVERALGILADGVKLLPDDSELRRSYAVALLNAGRVEASIRELETCLKLWPDWGLAQVSMGIALLNQKQGETACRYFEAAEKAGVKSASLYAGWGRAALGLGRVDDAISRFDQALTLEPMDWNTRYILANLLLQRGAAAAAIVHYKQIVAQSPDFVDAHNELGIAYTEIGNLAEARREFGTVLKLQPENRDAAENLRGLAP